MNLVFTSKPNFAVYGFGETEPLTPDKFFFCNFIAGK